jgi:hypothetical protein
MSWLSIAGYSVWAEMRHTAESLIYGPSSRWTRGPDAHLRKPAAGLLPRQNALVSA